MVKALYQRALGRAMSRILRTRVGGPGEALLIEFGDFCRAQNVSDIQPLVTCALRRRVVALVTHPLHGPCVLKWTSPHGPSGGVLASTDVARKVASGELNIPAPTIMEIGRHYTFEERLELVPYWRSERCVALLLEFLDALEPFYGAPVDEGCLSTGEVAVILVSMLHRLEKPVRSPLSAVRLARLAGQIEEAVTRAAEEAGAARIGRSRYFDDLSHENLMLSADGSHLVLVDLEDLKVGSWLFDYCWLLVVLTRGEPDATSLRSLYEGMAARVRRAGRPSHELFRQVLRACLVLNSCYYRTGEVRERTRLLLALVEADRT
jgi:hypothetical protein